MHKIRKTITSLALAATIPLNISNGVSSLALRYTTDEIGYGSSFTLDNACRTREGYRSPCTITRRPCANGNRNPGYTNAYPTKNGYNSSGYTILYSYPTAYPTTAVPTKAASHGMSTTTISPATTTIAGSIISATTKKTVRAPATAGTVRSANYSGNRNGRATSASTTAMPSRGTPQRRNHTAAPDKSLDQPPQHQNLRAQMVQAQQNQSTEFPNATNPLGSVSSKTDESYIAPTTQSISGRNKQTSNTKTQILGDRGMSSSTVVAIACLTGGGILLVVMIVAVRYSKWKKEKWYREQDEFKPQRSPVSVSMDDSIISL